MKFTILCERGERLKIFVGQARPLFRRFQSDLMLAIVIQREKFFKLVYLAIPVIIGA